MASNWTKARLQYETSDCTQQEIADELGVSRQCVHNHVKKEGWLKFEGIDKGLPCTQPSQGSRAGLRSDDNIALVIDTYALTGSKRTACRSIGIDDDTLINWCKESPELSVTMATAREQHLIGQYRKIANAKDWKAAKEILARAPETKEQWGDIQEKGPTIILNIHRDEVVIDS